MNTHNTYNYTVVRQFARMTLVWGIVGMGIGVWAAAELAFPSLNLGIPWLSFGRLSPVHSSLLLFAFGGNALFATSYYVVQRTCHTRLFNDGLAAFTFWGWQCVIVLALCTLPYGMTSGKAFAELEWPIDILITIVWIAYAVVFFGTIVQRNTSYVYVANWFFGAYILAVAALHILNSAALPVGLWPMKSYSLYPGTVDAMVSAWYSQGLVDAFMPGAFFGVLYYFLPRQLGHPVYSYRLIVVQFWTFVSLALWAASQHLLYTALPDWTQSLGMVCAVFLIAPFLAGVINGFMTVSADWHRLHSDIILRFLVLALFFYGVEGLEGVVTSIRSVNAFTQYTDWTVSHVHAAGLGWIGFLAFGAFYAMLPRLFNIEQMYSIPLILLHFWFATVGTMLYLLALGGAGMVQSLMWYAQNDDGTLAYRFVESLQVSHPLYVVRLLGGMLYLAGMCLMTYNAWKTVASTLPKARKNEDSVSEVDSVIDHHPAEVHHDSHPPLDPRHGPHRPVDPRHSANPHTGSQHSSESPAHHADH